MGALVAVLDTDVLFGRTLRDVLLYAASRYIFQPRWSSETLEELRENLVARNKLPPEGAERLCANLRRAFEEAEVVGFEARLPEVRNHPKDRHVSAAALHAEASMIVTRNLTDFEPPPEGVRVLSPDQFLCLLLQREREKVVDVLRYLETVYKDPPLTLTEVLDTLESDAPVFVANVRRLLGT